MELQISDLWTAAGVLLGFQVASFAWRISHEVEVANLKKVSWIPPADLINLVSMVITSVGCFVLPGIGVLHLQMAAKLLGLSTLLFVGHSFSLAAHYELFNPRTIRSFQYFPLQEKIAVSAVTICALVYSVAAFR